MPGSAGALHTSARYIPSTYSLLASASACFAAAECRVRAAGDASRAEQYPASADGVSLSGSADPWIMHKVSDAVTLHGTAVEDTAGLRCRSEFLQTRAPFPWQPA